MHPGRLLGKRYRLGDHIGSGGMSEVFLADDLRAHRQVALKVVLPEVSGDVSRRKRFLREAQTLQKLDHPSIVRVYDYGEESDQLVWIAMEFIDGTSLGEILDRGPLPLREVVSIIAPVARALAAAHRAGFVHRDVKPDNILVRGDGRPVLVDFGITREIQYRTPSDTSTHDKLTRTGMLIGTPEYMSPEQVRATLGMDGRSDQFSLAAVAYEALTGARPFAGESPMAMIASVLTDPVVPVSTLVEGVPREVDEALMKALSKKVDARFATMEEFAEVLEEFVPTALSGIELAKLAAKRSVLPLPGAPTILDTELPPDEDAAPSRESTTEPSLPDGDRKILQSLLDANEPTPRIGGPLEDVTTTVAPTPVAALPPSELSTEITRPQSAIPTDAYAAPMAYAPLKLSRPPDHDASADSLWWVVLLFAVIAGAVVVMVLR